MESTNHSSKLKPSCLGTGFCIKKRGYWNLGVLCSSPFPKPKLPSLQLSADRGPLGISRTFSLDAFLKCLIVMKKSFICHPVSRRQVWKEFSQVTKALGNVFFGGKCKTCTEMFSLGVGEEEEIKHQEKKCFKSQVEEGYRGATKRRKGLDC
jgi:hypothetical protein